MRHHKGILSQMRLTKSIQNYEVTIAAGANSATQALSPSVNKARAYAYNNGFRSADTGYQITEDEPAVVLTNGSTVTVMTNTANATSSRIVSVQVVEWHSWAVVDVQHGSVTLTASGGTSQPQTNISGITRATDQNFSAIIHTGQTGTAASQSQNRIACTVEYELSGANIRVSRVSSTDNVTCYFSIIQFRPGVVKTVQQAVWNFSGTVASMTKTINSVTTAQTMLFWGGCSNNGFQNQLVRVDLTNATTLTATCGASANDNTRKQGVTVVEFRKKFVKRQSADIDTVATSASQENSTITAVNLGKTLVHRCGFSTNTASSNIEGCTVYPTSTTNIRTQRGNSSATTTTTSAWRALEMVA